MQEQENVQTVSSCSTLLTHHHGTEVNRAQKLGLGDTQGNGPSVGVQGQK